MMIIYHPPARPYAHLCAQAFSSKAPPSHQRHRLLIKGTPPLLCYKASKATHQISDATTKQRIASLPFFFNRPTWTFLQNTQRSKKAPTNQPTNNHHPDSLRRLIFVGRPTNASNFQVLLLFVLRSSLFPRIWTVISSLNDKLPFLGTFHVYAV